ncbi:hypothetical protein T12_6181 [Trichinella patagoniensis]|uniref:Uncharacterized protein n=1 Tax=Trichinella patagoniensis TaxID=990121 RepID=A0A0V0ZXQ1_9BILA|nr:hypothetical protein T12_6181 [Trichinella patagoniensis]
MRKDGTDFPNAGNAISFGQLLSKMKLHADRIAALYTRTCLEHLELRIATLQAKLHVTVLLFGVVIPSDDGMKLKLTSFRSREKQVHAKCPSGALKSRLLKADYSNMYDNSTKQSLLLIGYFSGNAIELYRFGLNPSAGFFVSSFLISIIELDSSRKCICSKAADKCQLRRNRSSNCETTLTVTCCGKWSTAENDQVTICV